MNDKQIYLPIQSKPFRFYEYADATTSFLLEMCVILLYGNTRKRKVIIQKVTYM